MLRRILHRRISAVIMVHLALHTKLKKNTWKNSTTIQRVNESAILSFRSHGYRFDRIALHTK